MTKNIFYALAFVAFFLPAAAQAVEYSSVITDLPLIDGMTEKPDQALSFDKPDGRILKTAAETDLSPEAVLTFYKSALPALGWETPDSSQSSARALTFERKGEHLTVVILPTGGKTTVAFNIIPAAFIQEQADTLTKEYIKKNGPKQ